MPVVPSRMEELLIQMVAENKATWAHLEQLETSSGWYGAVQHFRARWQADCLLKASAVVMGFIQMGSEGVL